MRARSLLIAALILTMHRGSAAQAAEPMHRAELVFPLHDQHNHAPGIVELPDGGLLVSWYRGSGERSADDVAVYGSLRVPGGGPWTEAFLLVDTPGFPDCNTCLMCDDDNQVWLFWPVILANSWESCITHYRVYDYEGFSPFETPVAHGSILLKPDDFSAEALELLDRELGLLEYVLTDELRAERLCVSILRPRRPAVSVDVTLHILRIRHFELRIVRILQQRVRGVGAT